MAYQSSQMFRFVRLDDRRNMVRLGTCESNGFPLFIREARASNPKFLRDHVTWH